MKLKELAKSQGLKVGRCRYCNCEIIKKTSWQEVCKGIDCQKKRNAEKQKRWLNKIKGLKNGI